MARNAKHLNALIAKAERSSRPVTDRSLSAEHVAARVELGRRAGTIPSKKSKSRSRKGATRRAVADSREG